MNAENERWWRRVQWFDVLLVIVAVMVLLALTMEWWLPHYGPE